ncbi:MAG: quinoprotein dehydrogenase-associated SoxYZ-like carrier, partial [Methylotenera sp.]
MSKQTQSWLYKLMLVAGFTVASTTSAFAEADPKLLSVVKEAFFAKRDIQEVEFMKIEAPRRAESGAQVPVTFSYDKTESKGVD